jgi:nitroreductase
MQTFEAISARRDVRSYRDRPIPAEHLDQILEAGRRSPSAQNWQPWDFVLVTARDRLSQLAATSSSAAHVAGSAATVAVLAPAGAEGRRQSLLNYDLGQVTMSMMLAAADLGIGSGHASGVDQDAARELLGFPADRVCAYLVAFGYPAGRPLAPLRRPNRRPFSEVVHRERW